MLITVVLVDDHGIVRDGLRRLLESNADIKVVATAADGRSGIEAAVREKPRLVIMDLSMPGMNGIDAIRQITRAIPEVAVIVLSMHVAAELVRQAFDAGARGYMLKESLGDELMKAIRAVVSGRRYLGAGVAGEMIDWIASEVRGGGSLAALTPREREVLRLVAEGKSNTEAAAILALSPRTVETYRFRMMQKLGLADLPALVRFAIREGIVSAD